MYKDLVSIIVPFYNTPFDYWHQCLKSLCAQTYVNIEIVVVDDGSKPMFAEILDQTRNFDTRLRIFHKTNGGVSSARNYAIQHCNGVLLCFVDSDDWVEPDFVETLVCTLSLTGKHIASCNWIEEKGVISNPKLCATDPILLSKREAFKALICSTGIQGFLCNKIFEKNLVTQGLDESLYYCEDLVFNAYYLENIEGMSFIDRQLYHYRQTGGNATGDFSFNYRIFTLINAYQQVEVIFNKHLPEMQSVIRANIMKIALNLRARIKYNKINDQERETMISQLIHEYADVLVSDISIVEKLNILLTWAFPVSMFRLKNKMLKRTI